MVKINNKILKLRNSSIELLRIICMILIIFHHYSVHSGYYYSVETFSYNTVLMQFASLGGKIACCVFMLITGYFMIKSKINLKKIILLMLQTLFYSILAVLIVVISGDKTLEPIDYFKSLFPYVYGNWFIIVYLVLYILSPYINKMILSLEKKDIEKLILILIVLFSLIPSNFTGSMIPTNNIVMLTIMYIIGAYLRLYVKQGPKVLYKRMVIMCFALMILWVLFYDGMGMLLNKDLLISSATKVEGISSFVVVIISIFIFLHFSNNYVFHSRAINKIAATTLGIYLLHDNNYIRPKLWEEWFANKEYFCSKALILHMGIKCLAIFVICALIEYIRAKYIEKWIKRLIDKNWNKYVLKVKDKKEKIITKLNIES